MNYFKIETQELKKALLEIKLHKYKNNKISNDGLYLFTNYEFS